MIRNAVIIMLIFISAFSNNFASIDSTGLISSFYELFPGKNFKISNLGPRDFGKLIREHFEYSPQLRSMLYQIKSGEYTLKALEYSFSPAFLFGADYSNNSQFHREVIVNANIPVAWDNDNPIISNVNLPNGGVGIIWLPRPVSWAYKDIPLNASDSYRDQTLSGNIGITKKYNFGLQLNANANPLYFRLDPETYGFPWSSQISASFLLPLFKNFGMEGSPEVISAEKTRLQMIIENESINMIKNELASSLLNYYISIALVQKQLESLDSLEKLLDIQYDDVDLLTQNGRITIIENLSVKNSKLNTSSQRSFLIKNLVYLSSKLNVNPVSYDTVNLYIADLSNIDNFLDRTYTFFKEILTEDSLKSIIEKHPQVKIANLELKQSEIDMLYARNQSMPDISLNGTIGVFEQTRLGYSNPWNAVKGIGRPDGLTWQFGLNYTLPIKNAYDEYYEASVAAKMSQEENQLQSRKNLSDMLTDYIFNIKSSYENIKIAKKNIDLFNQIYENEAKPLFESKRMNRYDYSSYLIQIENSKMTLYSLQQSYFEYMFQFTSALNIDISEFIK